MFGFLKRAKDGVGNTLRTGRGGKANLPDGVAEKHVIMAAIAEQATEVTSMVALLNIVNQVPEGEKSPYDAALLASAAEHFAIAFKRLKEAVENAG